MSFTALIEAPILRTLIGKPDCVVLDCRFDLGDRSRGRAAYLSGHIPGAQYANLETELSGPVTANSGRHPLPSAKDFAAVLERWGIFQDTQAIVYDDAAGAYAARGWWLLRWLGHQSAALLDGGINAWLADGGLLETGEEKPPPTQVRRGTRIEPKADRAALLETARVSAFVADPANVLIDARAAERFSGAVEPIDSVAGHIAGAVNYPYSTNIGPYGCFLPAAELRSLWERRLGGTQPQKVAAMCGSGVTACHTLLSLEIAGFGGARLYAGSWSEWIRDPNRPAAKQV